MIKDKDKLIIECECIGRCSIAILEYIEDFKEFSFALYRAYPFKRKKEIYDLLFTKNNAQYIIEWFQKKPEDREKIFIEGKSSNSSGGIIFEWSDKFNEYNLSFYRKSRFNREKEIYGPTFSEDQAQQIIDFLQNKLTEEVSS